MSNEQQIQKAIEARAEAVVSEELDQFLGSRESQEWRKRVDIAVRLAEYGRRVGKAEERIEHMPADDSEGWIHPDRARVEAELAALLAEGPETGGKE